MAEETRGPTLERRETAIERQGTAILQRRRVAFIWRPDEADGGFSVEAGVVIDWYLPQLTGGSELLVKAVADDFRGGRGSETAEEFLGLLV